MQVTNGLKKDLSGILEIKDKLKASMEKVEEMSKQAAGSTSEISASTVEQVSGIGDILSSMERVQNGMEELAVIINQKN